MLHKRLFAVFLLLTAFLLAVTLAYSKTSADSTTVCDRYLHNDLIFTGSAETTWITAIETHKSPIHKRSEKSKRVRFLVREWFKGQRQNTVEVWMTPAECDLSVEANQTYLIYARLNKDNRRTESNGCMGSVPVASAASDLYYLTAAQLGAAQATRISGNLSAHDVQIKAQSGIDTRYAATDASGKFVFDGLHSGDWDLTVVGGKSSEKVHLEPNSCVDVMLKYDGPSL